MKDILDRAIELLRAILNVVFLGESDDTTTNEEKASD